MELIKTGVIPPAYANEYADLPASSAVKDEAFYEDLVLEEEIVFYEELLK